MKKLIATLIFVFALVAGLKAQTEQINVPQNLSEPIVILQTNYLSGWNFTIDDGVNPSKTTTIPLVKGVAAPIQYSNFLAQVLNKIAKQGYKLVSSNSTVDSSAGGIVYIFQKE